MQSEFVNSNSDNYFTNSDMQNNYQHYTQIGLTFSIKKLKFLQLLFMIFLYNADFIKY